MYNKAISNHYFRKNHFVNLKRSYKTIVAKDKVKEELRMKKGTKMTDMKLTEKELIEAVLRELILIPKSTMTQTEVDLCQLFVSQGYLEYYSYSDWYYYPFRT